DLYVEPFASRRVRQRVDHAEAVLRVGIVQVIRGRDVRQQVEATLLLQRLQYREQLPGLHDHAQVVAELGRGETVGAELLAELRQRGVVAHGPTSPEAGSRP